MVDRYHLAKVAVAAILNDKSFVDPNPDSTAPDSKRASALALSLADELIRAFGLSDKV